MNRFGWLSGFLARLEDEHVMVKRGAARELSPAQVLEIDPEDWGRVTEVAAAEGYRWSAIWADEHAQEMRLFSCFENEGDYLVLETGLALDSELALPSQAPFYPAADRMERHIHDLLGIEFAEAPDTRRWTRHQAWDEDCFPLRRKASPDGAPPARIPADGDYPFERIAGSGVYEIPVGPVHAGIIEPGHFRFQAVGEEVLNLEQHLGYVHRGVEKRAVGRDADGLLKLAARVSGDSAVAHAWAACQAIERAWKIVPSRRALQLRGLLAERERIANHIGDIGAICNDVGFAFAQMQCSRLREEIQRRNAELFGHRLLMDVLVVGGVTVDLDVEAIAQLRADMQALSVEASRLFDVLNDQPALEDRLLTTGRLSHDSARELGCTGYVGKASGCGFDVRSNNPYAPYDQLAIEPVVHEQGDVAARVRVRMKEVLVSLEWMDRLLGGLADGPVRIEATPHSAPCEGLGVVDGWRGETLAYVRFDEDGRVARYFPRDPSWHTWPALERIVMGNIVPDFPVCNKSVNGSYAGHDL